MYITRTVANANYIHIHIYIYENCKIDCVAQTGSNTSARTSFIKAAQTLSRGTIAFSLSQDVSAGSRRRLCVACYCGSGPLFDLHLLPSWSRLQDVGRPSLQSRLWLASDDASIYAQRRGNDWRQVLRLLLCCSSMQRYNMWQPRCLPHQPMLSTRFRWGCCLADVSVLWKCLCAFFEAFSATLVLGHSLWTASSLLGIWWWDDIYRLMRIAKITSLDFFLGVN